MKTVFKAELDSTYVSDAPYMNGRKGFNWFGVVRIRNGGPAESFVKFVIDSCPKETGEIECVISGTGSSEGERFELSPDVSGSCLIGSERYKKELEEALLKAYRSSYTVWKIRIPKGFLVYVQKPVNSGPFYPERAAICVFGPRRLEFVEEISGSGKEIFEKAGKMESEGYRPLTEKEFSFLRHHYPELRQPRIT